MTSKLNEIKEAWTEMSEEQVMLSTFEQILHANNQFADGSMRYNITNEWL